MSSSSTALTPFSQLVHITSGDLCDQLMGENVTSCWCEPKWTATT